MIGTTLAHYRIAAKLGEGGMGAVYRATDTRLGRDVALKVLPAEMAASPERLERFRREAMALAALDHSGIVTVFSVEEADGVQFLTMQLVEGEPLDRLIAQGGLPVERIREIATRLADALAAAHEKGIIHRDLKPANVMVAKDGGVKVLDFGLARMTAADEEMPGGSQLPTQLLTRDGVLMGTVPYMSPEQVSGSPVDHRTDLFSFGVILYEMATGRRPFGGRSSAELASAILRDSPPALGEARRDLPEGIAQAIERCLEKAAGDRPESARELCEALRAVPRVQTLAPTELAPASRPAPVADSGAVRADEGFWVAVLPFKFPGANTDLASLADGLSEEIVTGLSRFSYLRVISRSSTERYAGGAVDIRSVGEEIGARYVMEGSLRQAGTRLRLAVQLVDAKTGAHLWAENYERSFRPEALFELQDDLVPRVVSTVADTHGILPRRMAETLRGRAPDQLSPYEAVLRSFAYFERLTAEELEASRSALELAVREAPGYADAWAMLALLCAQDYGQGFELRSDSLARGETAARRAVEAAPSNHLAHFSLAEVLFFRRERQSFLNAAERAAALNPMDGNSLAFLGEMLVYSGEFERGLELAGRAKQLNPHHPGWYWFADYYHFFSQCDYRSALDVALKMNMPDHWAANFAIAAACGHLGQREAGEKAVRKMLELRPGIAATFRRDVEKWWESEYVEHLIDGLRKAGLDDPQAGASIPDATAPLEPATGSDAGSPPSEKPPNAAVAIAVLPFADMSPAKDQDYFCEGMAEEVMNALVAIDGIRVASRTSAFRASREGHDLAEIGRLLGVGQVLEGSVRSAARRLRVTAQLSDVETGYQLWSERFDRPAEDVFAIQDEIATGVVKAVESRLAPGERAVRSRPQTRNLEAYRCYLKARYLRARELHADAQRAFEEAIHLDPSHAPSWTGLADLLAVSTHFGLVLPLEACAAARKALATAAELERESVEALHGEAFVAYVERRWQHMETTWRRALELEPTHLLSLAGLGTALCVRRRFDEGMHLFERMREVDPLSAFPYVRLVVGHMCWRRHEEALGYVENALIFEKEELLALWMSSMAKVALGRHDEAIAEAKQTVELSRRGPVFLGTLGWVLATADRSDEARAVLDELRERPADSPAAVSEAWLLGGLGELDEACEVIDRADEEYNPLLYFTALPPFDPLRNDPRFAALLKKLELPSPS